MTEDKSAKLVLRVDSHNQWFVSMWVFIGERKIFTRFKVDTGCNAMILSHSTLKSLGFSTKETDLSKLPLVVGRLASGDKHTFRKLGTISLCQDEKQTVQICQADAICHTTKETHDLLGTEVLRQFSGVTFGLADDKYMELK